MLTVNDWPPFVVPLTAARLIVPLELLEIVLDTLNVVVLPIAERSTAPTVEILPPSTVLPVPEIVTLFSCVVVPKAPVVIVPPLLVRLSERKTCCPYETTTTPEAPAEANRLSVAYPPPPPPAPVLETTAVAELVYVPPEPALAPPVPDAAPLVLVPPPPPLP